MEVPGDIISLIVDEVRDDIHTLCQCSLASRHFLWPCQHYLFSKIAYRAEKMKQTTFVHLTRIFKGSNNIGVHITHLVLSGLLDRNPNSDHHSLFKKVYTFIPLKASELQIILVHTPNLRVLMISCVTLLPQDWNLEADFVRHRPIETLRIHDIAHPGFDRETPVGSILLLLSTFSSIDNLHLLCINFTSSLLTFTDEVVPIIIRPKTIETIQCQNLPVFAKAVNTPFRDEYRHAVFGSTMSHFSSVLGILWGNLVSVTLVLYSAHSNLWSCLSLPRGYLGALKACHALQSFALDGILPPRQFCKYFGSWEMFTASILSLPEQIQDIKIEFRIPTETLEVITKDLENLFHHLRSNWDPIDEALVQLSELKSINIGLIPSQCLSEEVEAQRASLSAEFEDNVKLKLHRADARGVLRFANQLDSSV